MALSPSRYSSQSGVTTQNQMHDNRNNVSVAASNPSLPPLSQSVEWRPMSLPSRGASPVERIQLPSIRNMLNVQLGDERTEPNHRSDVRVSPTSPSAMTIRSRQPEHVSSPVSHKRRRLSHEDNYEDEHRDTFVLQLDRSAQPRFTQRSQSAAIPSQLEDRRLSNWSNDSWLSSQSSRTAPYEASGMLSRPRPITPPYQPAPPEWQPQPSRFQLPSLQTLTQVTTMPRPRSTFNEYALDSARPSTATYQQQPRPSFDPAMAYYHQAPPVQSPYGYQEPRGLSYSGPSGYAVTHDRAPFSAVIHHGYAQSGYGYGMDNGEGETKQRKRRGNLPKETTDTLRAWFVAHLHHPYPTEDEKQDLMRQTGLQMNQISNWFINARRRQLPAMINNARAESDARLARPGPGPNFGEGERGRRAESGGLSDGESGFGQDDAEYEIRGRGISIRGRSRESI